MHAVRVLRSLAVATGLAVSATALIGGGTLGAQGGDTLRPLASPKPIVYRSVKQDVSPRLDSGAQE
jgi:hypothetical protein